MAPFTPDSGLYTETRRGAGTKLLLLLTLFISTGLDSDSWWPTYSYVLDALTDFRLNRNTPSILAQFLVDATKVIHVAPDGTQQHMVNVLHRAASTLAVYCPGLSDPQTGRSPGFPASPRNTRTRSAS